jgi:outer membrane cobalamin receptor
MHKNLLRISVFFLYGIFSIQGAATAQTIVLQEIEPVTVEAERTDYFTNAGSTTIDSLMLSLIGSGDVGQSLQAVSAANIKKYGASGSLSTINMRGAGAENTSVKYNGFALNSISTGSMDLSLLPSTFFESIQITPGAEAGLFGSGTFGGAVELSSFSDKYINGSKIWASSELGSYGNQKYNVGGHIKNPTFQYKTSALLHKARNNFPFINKYKIGQPREIRQHNAFQMYSMLHSAEINLSPRDKLDASAMIFSKEMQIPEMAASSGTGHKMQRDSGVYLTVRFNKLINDGKINTGTAVLLDALNYTDRSSENSDNLSVDSQIKAIRILNDFSYRYYLSETLTTESGFSFNVLKAESNNYPKAPHEMNGNFFSALRYVYHEWTFKLTGRAELSEYYEPKPIFSGGVLYSAFGKKLTLSASLSKQFRRPTFNERFWQPGGNIRIAPENAMHTESGFTVKLTDKKHLQLSISHRSYYTKIHNMIRWVPLDGIWTAQNNREVYNRGFENDLNFRLKNKRIHARANLAYYYTRSDTEGGFFFGNEFENLMYVPKHRIKFFGLIGGRSFHIGIAAQYTGMRRTTDTPTLNNELPAYITADIYSTYHHDFKQVSAEIKFRIENITDTAYESIKAYPSPGRMFFLTLSLSYKHNSHEN